MEARPAGRGAGLIIGATCGLVVTAIVYLWQHSLTLGLLVGISLFLTLIVATLAGSMVPLLMHKMKIDPAVASGPFISTINDLISVFIYFGLATTFMQIPAITWFPYLGLIKRRHGLMSSAV